MILTAVGVVLGFVAVVFIAIGLLEIWAGSMSDAPQAVNDSAVNGMWTGLFGVLLAAACAFCLVHGCAAKADPVSDRMNAAAFEPVKILGISGWGDSTGALLYSELGAGVKADFGSKIEWQQANWDGWINYVKVQYSIVIGWSLGGDSAVRFVKYLIAHGLPLPGMLVTIAPRYQTDVKPASYLDWFLPYDSAQIMTAPMSNTHNFWTYGPMPSAPMTGAIENVNVFPYWHGAAPEAGAIKDVIEKFLAGQSTSQIAH